MKHLINLKNRHLYLIVIFTILYLIGVVFDFPFIRGIHDSVFPSEWPYYYVNTWDRIWMPILVFLSTLLLFILGFRKYDSWQKIKKFVFWSAFIIIIFVLHLSYVYFSRFGITVLFQRIVNPGMNGYFSSAVRVETDEYLKNFPQVIESLDQHARDHPPGSILLIKGVIGAVEKINFSNSLLTFVPAPDGDVKTHWDNFTSHEKVSALFLAFFYHAVGPMSIIVVFFIAKLFFSTKTSLSLSLLGGLIPSISFFALKFDPFYFLLFCITTYFSLSGIRRERNYYLAGFFASISILFSYSVFPALAILGLNFVVYYFQDLQVLLNNFVKIIIGFLIPILLMLLVGYNSFYAFFPIVMNQAPRSYWQWVIYNPFDFFQYLGVPLTILFFVSLKKIAKESKKDVARITLIFIVLFMLLNVSGISRAEVGRIWMPLMLFPLLAIGCYKKLTLGFVLTLAVLLFIQNIIMTEFWVPIW